MIEASGTDPCKICGGPATPHTQIDLGFSCGGPHPLSGEYVPYHRCAICGFIYTRFMDHWTSGEFAERIYNDIYGHIDPGYDGWRARMFAPDVIAMLGERRPRILDYGGGKGVLSGLLREAGFEAESYDPFSSPKRPKGLFDLVIAVEVLEHSVTPMETLQEMRDLLEPDGAILATTLVGSPRPDADNPSDYIAPRNGHVQQFTIPSLMIAANQIGARYYAGSSSRHLFTFGSAPVLEGYQPAYVNGIHAVACGDLGWREGEAAPRFGFNRAEYGRVVFAVEKPHGELRARLLTDEVECVTATWDLGPISLFEVQARRDGRIIAPEHISDGRPSCFLLAEIGLMSEPVVQFRDQRPLLRRLASWLPKRVRAS